MKFETRINENNQVLIPTHFIKKYKLKSEDVVEWNEDGDQIIIIFKNMPKE